MEVTVNYKPGGWKRPAGWTVNHDECVIERSSIQEIRDTFAAHMRDYHGETVDLKSVKWRYVFNGKDLTADLARAAAARAAVEKADRRHRVVRIEVARKIRENGVQPEDPVVWEAVAQVMGYESSTVVMFVRESPGKYKS